MKRILLLVLLAIFLFLPQKAFAQDKNPKRQPVVVTVPQNQTISNDYYAYGDRIEIMGNITGDAYLAGGEIIIDGTINGDLLAVGGMITINGKIGQDARIVGGQMTINGEIVKNLSYACGNFQLAKNARIGNSILAVSGNSDLSGNIGRDVRLAAGNVNLNNTIGRDASIATGNLRVTSGTQIVGKLDYWSNPDASIDQSARIGEVVKHQAQEMPKFDRRQVAGALSAFAIFNKISSFLMALLIGFLFIKFIPNYLQTTIDTLKNRLAGTLGWGFLFLVLTPIISIILMITVFGIPVGIIILVLYFISMYLAKILVAPYIGQLIFKDEKGLNFKQYFVGLLIIYILSIIPIIGGIFSFLVLIAGLGVIAITQKIVFEKARKEKIY